MAAAAAGHRAVKDAVIGSRLPRCAFSNPGRDYSGALDWDILLYGPVGRAQAWYIENSRSDALMPMHTPQNIQR
jgi:hypothetical protein